MSVLLKLKIAGFCGSKLPVNRAVELRYCINELLAINKIKAIKSCLMQWKKITAVCFPLFGYCNVLSVAKLSAKNVRVNDSRKLPKLNFICSSYAIMLFFSGCVLL